MFNTNKFEINVFSDFDAKKRWLKALEPETTINLTNEYNIIDEFDSHHNYLQSMFNYVQDTDDKITFDVFRYIYLYTLELLKIVKMDKINKNEKLPNIPNNNVFNKYFEQAFTQSQSMIYNKDYGFEFLVFNEINPNNIICTPFTRKDTPVKNSNFSNILLRLILTFKTYIITFNKQLQDFDFKYLELNTHIIEKLMYIKTILTDLNSDYITRELEINDIKLTSLEDNLSKIDLDIKTNNYISACLKTIFTEFYKDCSDFVKLMIIFVYLLYANDGKLKITKIQYNMSFQDIILNNYNQWQIGYTGTAYLELNDYKKYDINDYVFKEIIIDPDEKIEVLLALNKYGYTNEKKKNNIIIN